MRSTPSLCLSAVSQQAPYSGASLSIFFPLFFFFMKVSPNKMHMAFSNGSSYQCLVWGTFSCHNSGVYTNHGGGEITRRQSSTVAAKMGFYCLKNKFRMCGQMVLMVEVCAQLEGSKFLKNKWVWWYSFFSGSKVVESNFLQDMVSLVFHCISSL